MGKRVEIGPPIEASRDIIGDLGINVTLGVTWSRSQRDGHSFYWLVG